MLRRRQVIVMVSIAVVALLVGTMLNLNLLTTAKEEDESRPVWETYVTGVNATALPDVWNVNVTNWPISTDVNVWWHEYVCCADGVFSSTYKANGFSQLHVLAVADDLGPTETAVFLIYGVLWNAEHTECYTVEAARTTIDWSYNVAAMTIPVPSEDFFFYAYTAFECEVSLSFYLTWA